MIALSHAVLARSQQGEPAAAFYQQLMADGLLAPTEGFTVTGLSQISEEGVLECAA